MASIIPPDHLYKIYDHTTKLFSGGGNRADQSTYGWSKKGKIWRSARDVKLHLRQLRTLPDTWIVQEFTLGDREYKLTGEYKPELFNAK